MDFCFVSETFQILGICETSPFYFPEMFTCIMNNKPNRDVNFVTTIKKQELLNSLFVSKYVISFATLIWKIFVLEDILFFEEYDFLLKISVFKEHCFLYVKLPTHNIN